LFKPSNKAINNIPMGKMVDMGFMVYSNGGNSTAIGITPWQKLVKVSMSKA
jgi:hypothetical protein